MPLASKQARPLEGEGADFVTQVRGSSRGWKDCILAAEVLKILSMQSPAAKLLAAALGQMNQLNFLIEKKVQEQLLPTPTRACLAKLLLPASLPTLVCEWALVFTCPAPLTTPPALLPGAGSLWIRRTLLTKEQKLQQTHRTHN